MEWHYAERWKGGCDDLTGWDFYRIVANNLAGNPPQTFLTEISGRWDPEAGYDQASRLFAQYGIDGIQVDDQFSRGKKTGTRNFVVFRDDIIQIVAKDGKPIGG